MFTPMSTASTATGPPAATSGNSTSTAGRLLIRFDSTTATAAMPSRAGSVVSCGSSTDTASPRPRSSTALTSTPSASTATRNGTLAARTMPNTVS